MAAKKAKKPDSITLKIGELILDKKGYDIKILDVQKLTNLTDYFIICTSDSAPQTKAIVEHIEEELKKQGIRPLHIEGKDHLDWVLLDYINIVVNVFNKDMREFYNIERLWSDAIITQVKPKSKKQ